MLVMQLKEDIKMSDKIKLYCVETPSKVFITNDNAFSTWSDTHLEKLFYDGVKASKTFKKTGIPWM